MALDNEDYPFKSAAPIASSGLDVDELLARNPETMAQARAMGLPFPASPGLVSGNPIIAAAVPESPAVKNVPSAAGTSANQTPQPRVTPQSTPDDGTRGMMPNFGSSLAQQAQSQTPANNAPATPGETPASPSVPATVTPSGTPEDPNQAGIQRAGQMAEGFAEKLASQQTLAEREAPFEAQRPTTPLNPMASEYRPTKWQRVGRGVLGGVEGLARGGIRGAVLGAVDPAAVGATPYGAPNRAFSIAAQQRAGLTDIIGQQEKQTEDVYKEDTARAKDIITSINDIGKNYAQGQSSQARLDTAAAREEMAKVAGQLADVKKQLADYTAEGKTPTTYEATVAAAALEKDPARKAALEAAAKEMADTEVKKFRSVAGGGGGTFRQSAIDLAADEVKALQDEYQDSYSPSSNTYQSNKTGKIISPDDFADMKQAIVDKLNKSLATKKLPPLDLNFNRSDIEGTGKPTSQESRAQRRAGGQRGAPQVANKPKPPTPTEPPPQGAVDMALGSDGQWHYRDSGKRAMGVVK